MPLIKRIAGLFLVLTLYACTTVPRTETGNATETPIETTSPPSALPATCPRRKIGYGGQAGSKLANRGASHGLNTRSWVIITP